MLKKVGEEKEFLYQSLINFFDFSQNARFISPYNLKLLKDIALTHEMYHGVRKFHIDKDTTLKENLKEIFVSNVSDLSLKTLTDTQKKFMESLFNHKIFPKINPLEDLLVRVEIGLCMSNKDIRKIIEKKVGECVERIKSTIRPVVILDAILPTIIAYMSNYRNSNLLNSYKDKIRNEVEKKIIEIPPFDTLIPEIKTILETSGFQGNLNNFENMILSTKMIYHEQVDQEIDKAGVYMLYCKTCQARYVGQTISLNRRKDEHDKNSYHDCNDTRNFKRYDTMLVIKEIEIKFDKKEVAEITKTELKVWERLMVYKFKNYNIQNDKLVSNHPELFNYID